MLVNPPCNVVFNMDCMKGMRSFPDKFFDIAIVDPEWGRKQHGGVDRSGYVLQENGKKLYVKNGNHYKKKDWDNEPVGEEYFAELTRVSKHQIIWGCNYYTKNLGNGRIIWDKVNEGSDQSDCEIAYNSRTDRVDLFRFMWRGMMQGKSIAEGHIMQGNKKLNEKRIHPTQKPVALYDWTIREYASDCEIILDTHVGSGSSRIAAKRAGKSFVGFETDVDYWSDEEQRYKEFENQLTLFQVA